MARSRNIKPGFFSNDVLGELPPLARLLFAGLWTICDREGRAEDRPKRIKNEILGYDECDADHLLQKLHDAGFILRYEAGGKRLIQVLTWHEHQNPHVKEAASTLPAPDKHGATQGQEPDKHQANPTLEPVEKEERTEQAVLIPSSLIPDSLSSDPLPPLGERGKPRPTRKAPPSFAVTAEMRRWAAEHAAGVDIDTETEKFRDHTFGSTCVDWPGRWRNWLRRVPEFGKPVLMNGKHFNRQEALEESNRAVGDRWLAEKEKHDASR